MAKKEYRYNEETFEYESENDAFLDPLETESAGKDVYLLSANCTFEKPKTPENMVAIFNKEKKCWEYAEKLKDKSYYDFDKEQIVRIKENKVGAKYRILTEEEISKINSGMKVKDLGDDNYDFYFEDSHYIDIITSTANNYLSTTDFYFLPDYPSDKIPTRMAEYRAYLRTLNSEKNLEGKNVSEIKVLSYEEFEVNE